MIGKAERGYSLIALSARLVAEQGLVTAEWRRAEVPRKRMKELTNDLREAGVWFLCLAAFGARWFWGSWPSVPCFIVYGLLCGSAADAHWHETGRIS